MAILENMLTEECIILQSQHTIGRNRNNLSILNESDVSRKHAVIYWEGNSWFLTDYSSNGTKLNNIHLHHSTHKLKENDIIQFSSKETGKWKLINSNRPCSFLKAVHTPRKYVELENGIMFPTNSSRWVIFRNNKQNWIIDNGITETVLEGGKMYYIDTEQYIFIENECQKETQRNIDITENACFELTLSNDEEDISAQIKINDLVLDLGNRAYNHLLLHLARIKKQDLESGMSEHLCGWVHIDALNHALSKEILQDIDEYYINNQIYRLRKNLLNLSPFGHLFANIIERKKGKLRFGMSDFKIKKEQMLTK